MEKYNKKGIWETIQDIVAFIILLILFYFIGKSVFKYWNIAAIIIGIYGTLIVIIWAFKRAFCKN
jgi:small neutral amino acid transporter SnatA (MarC family)